MPFVEYDINLETAMKIPSCGDHVMFVYESGLIVLVVQVVPFADVAHTFTPTAQNNPSDGLHATELYVPAGIVLTVHVTPSGEDAATLAPTATHRASAGE